MGDEPFMQGDPQQEEQQDRFSYDAYDPAPRRKRKKRRWPYVLCAVILVVWAAGAIVVSSLDISLIRTGDGFYLSVGKNTAKTPAADADPEPLPVPPQSEAAFARPAGTHNGSGTTLTISGSQPGVPNEISDQAGALSLQQIYQKVIPSVVTVTARAANGAAGLGTGIIMSADGYIITNCHVIANAQSVSVRLESGEDLSCAMVGSDETSDLAVLKVEADGLTAAVFGDSAILRVGDRVAAIGNPLGTDLRGTMTDGIISGISRDLSVDGRKMSLIQTNAALNNGNSGGPLINCYGQVVGVNTMKMSSYYASATVEGLGFAIPVSTAKPIVDELIEKGYVSGRPAIGITGESLPRTVQIYYQLPDGVYITAVQQGSDAANKGIRPGDIITALNKTTVSSVEELNVAKGDFVAGDTVTLTIYRSGQSMEVDIVLMDQADAT